MFLWRVFTLLFNWGIIALQCCVRFCYTTMWISSKYSSLPFLLSLSPTPIPSPCPSPVEVTHDIKTPYFFSLLYIHECASTPILFLFLFFLSVSFRPLTKRPGYLTLLMSLHVFLSWCACTVANRAQEFLFSASWI